MLRKLILDPFRIGVFAIDLVYGNHQRNTSSLGVLNRLDSLRHDTVIRSNYKNHYVGRLCAACSHRRKRRVSWCIEERDLTLIGLN